jgi:hypothetical protein
MSDATPQAATDAEINDVDLSEIEARRQQLLKEATEQAEQRFTENVERLVAQADELQREHERISGRQDQINARNAELQRIAEEDRKRRAAQEAELREGEIRDAHSRYAQALGDEYDIRDPYGSLARASMVEYGSFMRDREELTRQIAAETDPYRRRTLELQRDIESNDYMALTSRRIAGQSEYTLGRSDTDEAVRQRERATQFEADAKDLRQQYREHVAEQEPAGDAEAEKVSEASPETPPETRMRQRGHRTSRDRNHDVGEEQAEVEDTTSGDNPEPRRRAQRGERETYGELSHTRARGLDLER